MTCIVTRTAIQLTTLEDLDETIPEQIDRVSNTSLDGIEFGLLEDVDTEAIAAALDRSGLTAVGAFVTQERLENDYSSLLVESDSVEWPLGIVTTTDVLEALTVTEDDRMNVQVFGVDLLDTLTRGDIAERIERIDEKYGDMDVLEANVVFHQHQERNRGIHLILSTVRLFTDEGRFSGSAEEYGAKPAFRAAADVVEENVIEDKERKQTLERNKMDRERTQRLLGWWLEG
jgi:hypothetical protein